MSKSNSIFAGQWQIFELPNMMDEYLEEGESKPAIRLVARYEDMVNGEYEIGLSSGGIDGSVRTYSGPGKQDTKVGSAKVHSGHEKENYAYPS